MSEDSGIPTLMSSFSTKANDLVVELSWLRAQNTGLRTEASILRKQRDDLHERVLELQVAVLKHQATEAQLQKTLRRVSDMLSSADISSETNPMSQSAKAFSPPFGQTALFDQGTSKPSSSKQVTFGETFAFGKSNDLKLASPFGNADDPEHPSEDVTFGNNTGSNTPSAPLGTLFDTAKCGDTQDRQNPFMIDPVQQPFSSSPQKGFFQNSSESTEAGKKSNLMSSTVGEPSAAASTEATSKAVKEEGFGGATIFPFTGSPNSNVLAAKAEPVAENKKGNRLVSPFDENTKKDLSGASRTACFPTQTSGSFAQNHGEPNNIHSSCKELPNSEQNGQTSSNTFPLPTPLSRDTFGLSPMSKTLETGVKKEQGGSEKVPLASTFPPPRSASFSYCASSLDECSWETISAMPFFNSYSVEEIRLWDYVNGDLGPMRA